jgi:hypothetical protein
MPREFEMRPEWGAKQLHYELLCLLVNRGVAHMFANWPILTERFLSPPSPLLLRYANAPVPA